MITIERFFAFIDEDGEVKFRLETNKDYDIEFDDVADIKSYLEIQELTDTRDLECCTFDSWETHREYR